jgi:hypothetical protein
LIVDSNFTGVWNNGLVKGRPYLTFLENTQWIDGEFSGGHFKGLTGSILYDTLSVLIAEVGTEKLGRQDIGNYIETKFDNNGSVINYNQSLIQNFSFDNVYDVNSGTGSDARYDSWIDLNYSTQSQTNLNKNSITYKSRPTGTFSAEYFV